MAKFGTRQIGKITVIDVDGDFLEEAARELKDFTISLIREGRLRVLLNFKELSRLDDESFAWCALVETTMGNSGGYIAYVVSDSFVEACLRSSLLWLPSVFRNEQEALEWLEAEEPDWKALL